jgi:DNA ligase (NAD+)
VDSIEDYLDSLPISKKDIITVLINQKKDGTSLTIDYKYDGNSKYIAKSAICRGRKDYGEGTDASIVVKGISVDASKVKKVFGYLPEYIGIQNEFLVSLEQREKLEKYLNRKFSNLRSASTGLLRRMIFSDEFEILKLRSFMSLVPVGFDILPKYQKKIRESSWSEKYEAVCKTFIYGDVNMDYDIFSGTKNDILEKMDKISSKQYKNRNSLNHAIDGLVLTVVDDYLQKELGRKSSINQYQIAYKFQEECYKTIVRDIIVTTGNFGYKGILLKVDPVILNGTVQGKAQIHSIDKWNKMSIRVGDEIMLKLSGDVIPFGYKDSNCRRGNGKKLKLPTHCDCGSELVEENNMLRCPNKKCPHRVIGSLITFFKELNSKGIGDKICEQLYHECGVRKVSDIFNLTIDDFKSLKGFKDASAKICVDTIKEIVTRPRTIESILSALGIDSFRSTTARKILNNLDIQSLISLCESGDRRELESELRKVDGIDNNSSIIANGLIEQIDELKAILPQMYIKETNNPNYDKTILISGFRNDDKFESIANANEYNVKDTGKKFDILVIKDDSYLNKTKATLAKSKNIPIMTKDEFLRSCK